MRHHETLRTPRQLIHAFTRDPPGWAFHGVVAAGMAGFLYAVSFPGIAFFLAGVSSATLLAVAVLWVVRALGFRSARRRREEVERARLDSWWRRYAP